MSHPLPRRRFGGVICAGACLVGVLLRAESTAPGLSVADLIGLTRFGSLIVGGPAIDPPADALPLFSPDASQFAVVVQKGNLAHNTREFSLLVFSATVAEATPPRVLARFATDSNRPGISQLAWLTDDVLAFRAEQPGQLPQVYTVSVATGKLVQQTWATEELTVFRCWDGGATMLYVTEPATGGDQPPTAHGIVVPPTLNPAEVIERKWDRLLPESRANVLHMRRDGHELSASIPVAAFGHNYLHGNFAAADLSVSPSGEYAILSCRRNALPAAWRQFDDGDFQRRVALGRSVVWWIVVDLRTLVMHPLADSPWTNFSTPPLWMPEGRSVVLVNDFVPLGGTVDSEREFRAHHRVTAEIDVASGAVSIITAQNDLRLGEWNTRTATLTLVPEKTKAGAVIYQRAASGWREVQAGDLRILAAPKPETEFTVVQGPNEPWQLVARTSGAAQVRQVYDPNPGLRADRAVARMELIQWKTKSGARLEGGLYLPLGYLENTRYPLVIQTHGFRPKVFAPEGYATTGYAAQPLAAAGIMVVQAYRALDTTLEWDRLSEGEKIREAWEALIEELDRRGAIDCGRIGLQGYSRACYHILYFLTHSSRPIAAASCTDGVDLSYLQHLLLGLADNALAREDGTVNGGVPFGARLSSWLERAPGFNLHRVSAPLQLVALSSGASLLAEWEPFAGLMLQGKPAELLYLPDATHNLVRPWERFASEQGAVDWFRFWLQGFERTEPVPEVEETPVTLRAQYERWGTLREMRDANSAQSRAQSPTTPP